MRTYKARNRNTLIEQRNRNSLMHLIKNKDLTMEQKRALVLERNPYLYIFGKKLKVASYE
jgi:hypothetical protein